MKIIMTRVFIVLMATGMLLGTVSNAQSKNKEKQSADGVTAQSEHHLCLIPLVLIYTHGTSTGTLP